MRVVKRDGRIVKFNSDTIVNAVNKARQAVGMPVDNSFSEGVALGVVNKINGSKEISVEEIQDMVEDALIMAGVPELAKHYILYRAERTGVRAAQEYLGIGEDDLKFGVNALSLLDKRYLKTINGKKETPSQLFKRVAKHIASVENNPEYWEKVFYNLMSNKLFMPNTPCLANSGIAGINYLFACVSGDTVIRCTAGDYSIKDLSGGILGDNFDVLTIRDNEVSIAKAFNAKKTGVKDLYRVAFDDGSYLDVTGDHKIMLRTGEYCEVSNLNVGVSVMPFNYGINHGYQIVFKGISDRPIATHKLVMDYYGNLRKSSEVIHHKDYNKRNNCLVNLEVLDKKEHIAWHMKNANEFNCMYNPEVAAKISKHMMGNIRALGCKRSNEYKLDRSINNPNYKTGEHVKLLNHKVASVKFLRTDDVYDMSVEGTHNFAANNVFIHNCYAFDIQDSMESIFGTLKDAAMVQKTGGGVGLNLSNLRPAGDAVKSTEGVASGPVDFMRAFDITTDVVKQGGIRRGGNLGLMNISHPDIVEFIQAKNDESKLNNFNISVALTDEFMYAVKEDRDFNLVNPKDGAVSEVVKARELFRTLTESAWKNGEPGIVFWDKIEVDNPTPSLGHLIKNLCGEQDLVPYEACVLGSINLEKFVADGKIVYTSLRKVINHAVRFLDNVIDASDFPLEKIEKIVRGNRKIGLGVMGFADMLYRLGISYDSDEAVSLAEEVMSFVNIEAHKASAKIADDKGSFPNIGISVIGTQQRNATITTIAPTGSISMIAETSSGIEPVFAVVYQRSNILDSNTSFFEVNEILKRVGTREGWFTPLLVNKIIRNSGSVSGISEIPDKWQKVFVTALEISPKWHIKMQAAFQKYVDNSISKTINLPYETTIEEVENIVVSSFESGLKGMTVFRSGSRSTQVLELCPECAEEGGSCSLKPLEG